MFQCISLRTPLVIMWRWMRGDAGQRPWCLISSAGAAAGDSRLMLLGPEPKEFSCLLSLDADQKRLRAVSSAPGEIYRMTPAPEKDLFWTFWP